MVDNKAAARVPKYIANGLCDMSRVIKRIYKSITGLSADLHQPAYFSTIPINVIVSTQLPDKALACLL
jgi:hypothetical protein